MFRSLWAYRGFILGSVKREFQLKYRNSLIGVAWLIIQPASMIVVYTVIFSKVMNARLEGINSAFGYGIFLCGGIMTWGLFVEITTRCQNVFIDNANLIKKINFPRLCLPVIIVLSALLNFGIVLSIFTIFLLLTGSFPGAAYLALVPLFLLIIIIAAGLGVALGILNVFFRDIGQFFGIFITFWFWLTPIVYPSKILPNWAVTVLVLNPLNSIIISIQGVFVMGSWPNWTTLHYPLILSLILCVLSLNLFRRRVGEIVDEL